MSDAELRVENILFSYFLQRGRKVTDAWFAKKGRWDMDSQIAHAHSEVSEVYRAIRKNEGRYKVLEEICDSILSALTMAHVGEYSDEEIMLAMEFTLQKIEQRAGIKP
jgi:NTP pyrophosphatase (non-canonical NTP hydrolase)